MEAASANLSAQGSAAPQVAGEANDLSRLTGLPPETVERTMERVKAFHMATTARGALESNAVLAAWMANPRNAAVGRDDVLPLDRVGRAAAGLSGTPPLLDRYGADRLLPTRRPEPGLWNIARGIGASFRVGVAGLEVAVADALGQNPDATLRQFERATGRRDEATPEFGNRTVGYAYAGVQQLAMQAPAIAASIATRSPAFIVAQAGGQTGGEAYGKYRLRGGTSGEAALGAVGEAGVEVLTELIPMGFLVEAFGKAGARSFFGGLLGRELPSEQVATLAQDAIDTAIANPNKTWGEYWAERPEAAYATLVQTLVQAGIPAAANAALRGAMGAKAEEAQAKAETEALGQVAAAVEAAKATARDPEAVSELLAASLSEGMGEKLYVDADAVRQLYQDAPFSPGDADDTVMGFQPDIARQLDQTLLTGGAIVLDTARAIPHLVRNKTWEKIVDRVRLSPGGASMKEAAEAASDEGMVAAAEEAGRAVAEEFKQMAGERQIAAIVEKKLKAAGFRPENAALYAIQTARYYATRAARMGKAGSALEMFQKDGFDVEDAELKEMAAVEEASPIMPRPIDVAVEAVEAEAEAPVAEAEAEAPVAEAEAEAPVAEAEAEAPVAEAEAEAPVAEAEAEAEGSSTAPDTIETGDTNSRIDTGATNTAPESQVVPEPAPSLTAPIASPPATAPAPVEDVPSAPASDAAASDAPTLVASPPAPTAFGAANTRFTTAAKDKAMARMKARAAGNQLNAGIDPEMLRDGIQVVGWYVVEGGIRRFAEVLPRLRDDMGVTARWLQEHGARGWYAAVREMLEDDGEDVSDLDDSAATKAIMQAVIAAEAPVPTLEAESTDGDQGNLPASDDSAGPEDVSGASSAGGAGGISGREGEGGARPLRDSDAGSGAPAQRPPDGGGAPSGDGNGVVAPAGVPERVEAGNHIILPGSLDEARTEQEKIEDNLEAIRIVNRLGGATPTVDEQAEIARYVGWGGLKSIFDEDGAGWAKTYGAVLRKLLTPEEYETARRSTQYAHYTSEKVVRAMWRIAERLGFKGGRVFEPGMGTGNFPGMVPETLRGAITYTGVEYDRLTANIAAALYPRHSILQGDWTKMPVQSEAFDLAIGNPPFSETIIEADPNYAAMRLMMHDYFIAKSVDSVRPGGLVIMISSAGTLNKTNQTARQYIADRADLVGAIRLPGDAFAENAGTEVTTDIIILRKRAEGEAPASLDWVNTRPFTGKNRVQEDITGSINAYFVENPDMVLGEQNFASKLYPNRYGVRLRPGDDIEALLDEAIVRLPAGVMTDPADEALKRMAADFAHGQRKRGSFYVGEDGRLKQVASGGAGFDVKVSKEGEKRIRGLLPIRDALRDVFRADLAENDEMGRVARLKLNEAYDAFVKKFGPINKAEPTYRRPNAIQQESERSAAREQYRMAGAKFDEGSFDPTAMIEAGAKLNEIAAARKAARNEAERIGQPWDEGTFDPAEMEDVVIDKRPNVDPFMSDPEGYRLRAIEDYKDQTGEAKKADIFFRNIIRADRVPEINSSQDALLRSLNKLGRVDIPEMARLTGKSEAEVVLDLAGRIFKDPDEGWVVKERYLSGNVRAKLAKAMRLAASDPEYEANVAALRDSQPLDVPHTEINANLGASWIPVSDVIAFGRELGLSNFDVKHYPKIALWRVTKGAMNAAATQDWGTDRASAYELLELGLSGKPAKIYDTIRVSGSEIRTFNRDATQAANDKLKLMKHRFSEWIWEDEARRNRLARFYNDNFNNILPPVYDGSYLTTPGISDDWIWRPHQTAVIARIIAEGNTYMAHAVGAGKTSAMIGAGMEMRRLGLVQKPAYVVPNHMLGQFTKEFYRQYPAARIMVADEANFHTDRRKQFVADMATSDIDAVILTHSSFELVPLSDESMGRIIEQQLGDLRKFLQELKKFGKERFTVRRIEQQIEQLEQRMSRKRGRQDNVVTFEETGIDFLFVDEAHLFRKLDFATSLSVKGIDGQGSWQSMDLYAKTRYLEGRRKGRSHVLASGTPITNTMGELFTISRFLQEAELVARGIENFDAWAATFGSTAVGLEQTAAGTYKPVERFAQFVNVPELSSMVRQVMDVVRPDQLRQYVTKPKVTRVPVVVEASQEQLAYQMNLRARMEAIEARRRPPRKGDDIILSVINDGRNMAVDMRLVDPAIGRTDPPSKVDVMIERLFRVWKDTADTPFHEPGPDGYSPEPVMRGPATQMVFLDRGIGAGNFQTHRYIKDRLVELGIPAGEIVLFNNLKSSAQKQRVFNDMNEGKVRILIGSAAKMGTGVNAQRRLIALHNGDPHWYPSIDEQRNGRMDRQGNMNPAATIYDYSTHGTYDSTMWGFMARKAKFIEGFFRGDPDARTIDDLGEASVYEQAKAMTTTDPRMTEFTERQQELETERRRRSAYFQAIGNARAQARTREEQAAIADAMVALAQADAAQRQDIAGDAFTAVVGEKTFNNREAFNEAVRRATEAVRKSGKMGIVKIGSIAGFQLAVNNAHLSAEPVLLRSDPNYYLRLSPNDTASSVAGVIRSFEQRAIDNRAAAERSRAEAVEFRARAIDAPYPGEAKIEELAAIVRNMEEMFAREAAEADARLSARAVAGGEPDEGKVEDEDGGGARTLYQDMPAGPRAAVIMEAGRRVVRLFRKRDLSSFLHESGHIYLENLREDALDPQAPQQLRNDWEATKRWFRSNGHAVDDTSEIPTEAHELWARGIERFFMEGRSPSVALRRAFDAFRSWLITIYRSVDALNAPITDEIRDVMARLMATDAEIDEAMNEAAATAMFKTAAEAGMSDAQFDAYIRTVSDVRSEAFSELLNRVMKPIRDRVAVEWKAVLAEEQGRASAEIDAMPEFRALAKLRGQDGPRVKLDGEALEAGFGKDVFGKLPKGRPTIVARSGEAGMTPDELADIVGAQSGQALIERIIELEDRQRILRQEPRERRTIRQIMIDELAEARAIERFGGDPLADGRIEEEAREIIRSDQRATVIAMEMEALGRQAGRRPTAWSAAKRWASERVAAMEVRDLPAQAQAARRAEGRAGRQAVQLALNGDGDGAFGQKQAQLLNMALAVEAAAAAETAEKQVAYLLRHAENKIRGVAPEDASRVHALLERFSFRRRTDRQQAEAETLAEWAAAQQAAGYDVRIPSYILNEANRRHYSRMSVEELTGLHDTVKQMVHIGRKLQEYVTAEEKRKREELLAEAVAQLGSMPQRAARVRYEKTALDRVADGVGGMEAALRKIEAIVDEIDGDRADGVMNRMVFRPMADAQAAERDMLREYLSELVGHTAAVSKATIRSWMSRVVAPELVNRDGRPFVFQKHNVLQIALNFGNNEGRQRLIDGFGWSEEDIQAVLDRTLTEEDWIYITRTWETLDRLWPHIKALEERVNGLAPPRIKGLTIDTPFGPVTGGYYPIVYDPDGAPQSDPETGVGDRGVFGPGYTRATTSHGFTKERADRVLGRPLSLSGALTLRHIGEVIHDLTHREAIMQVDRFLTEPRLVEAMDAAIGINARRQFRPWLAHIANEWVSDNSALRWWEHLLRHARFGTQIAGLAFRLSTILTQFSGYANSTEYLGERWAASGLAEFRRSGIAAAIEMSPELRHRFDNIDRELREQMLATIGKGGIKTKIIRAGFHMITLADQAISIPTWYGAFNKARAEGLSNEDAVYAGDKAVRLTQGSAAAKDMVAFQRGPEFQRLLSIFYTYLSAAYNRHRRLATDAARTRRARDLPRLVSRAVWLVLLPPILSELIAGRGPDEDEDWGMWAFQRVIVGLFSGWPLIRDVAASELGGYPYRFTPAQGAVQSLGRTLDDLSDVVQGEEPSDQWLRNSLETAAYWLHIPAGANIATAAEFLKDVANDEVDPQDMGDWYEGLTKGRLTDE